MRFSARGVAGDRKRNSYLKGVDTCAQASTLVYEDRNQYMTANQVVATTVNLYIVARCFLIGRPFGHRCPNLRYEGDALFAHRPLHLRYI